jgi:hypothetical protein
MCAPGQLGQTRSKHRLPQMKFAVCPYENATSQMTSYVSRTDIHEKFPHLGFSLLAAIRRLA